MRISPIFFVVLILAAVFQTSVRDLPFAILKPDILWLGVLFLGFFVPLFPGGVLALALGLVQETLGAPFHGLLSLSYVLIYLLLRLGRQHIFFQRRTPQVIWVFLFSLAYRTLETGLLVWQGYEASWDGFGEWRLLAWALLQGLASLAVFPLFRYRYTFQRRRKKVTLAS